MRVSVKFNGNGLQLELLPETDPEKRMVGAVLNQPYSEPKSYTNSPVDETLVRAFVTYDGHWSNKMVSGLILSVARQENSSHGDNGES